jgi:hypothetical protein
MPVLLLPRIALASGFAGAGPPSRSRPWRRCPQPSRCGRRSDRAAAGFHSRRNLPDCRTGLAPERRGNGAFLEHYGRATVCGTESITDTIAVYRSSHLSSSAICQQDRACTDLLQVAQQSVVLRVGSRVASGRRRPSGRCFPLPSTGSLVSMRRQKR